ncbi:unnamed protein product [Cylicocyclus nassatus]|uniref:Uncharacterized protein n=1 Tax=Cylicocyclus nassatus TaxID=53992 RepID=A0AA36DNU9_CYLNA|nr:unnamed protein product [Cylicocyclus nassatus]
MHCLITGVIASISSFIPLTLVACNSRKDSRRSFRERNTAGTSARSVSSQRQLSSVEEVEPTQREDIRAVDSLKFITARRRIVVQPGSKKLGSSSDHTDVIIVPLGKAQQQVVPRSNLTKPNKRKQHSKRARLKVHFLDEVKGQNKAKKRPAQAKVVVMSLEGSKEKDDATERSSLADS